MNPKDYKEDKDYTRRLYPDKNDYFSRRCIVCKGYGERMPKEYINLSDEGRYIADLQEGVSDRRTMQKSLTLRIDISTSLNEKGDIEISYSFLCSECGLQFQFNHVQNIFYDPKQLPFVPQDWETPPTKWQRRILLLFLRTENKPLYNEALYIENISRELNNLYTYSNQNMTLNDLNTLTSKGYLIVSSGVYSLSEKSKKYLPAIMAVSIIKAQDL